MEANARWVALTAVAPVAWGANYYVTHEFLPADTPLYGAALRALPAGLVLLALCRQRPRGAWWWRSAVLGLLNMSVFFVLVYTASQLLPTSVASTVMAVSPLTMTLMAWPLVSERPRTAHLAGAAIGLGGVCLMLLTGAEDISVPGVLASAAAMLVSSFGHILAKRWNAGTDVLASTAWQLTAGGLFLLPVAAAVEGPPPALSPTALLAFAYVALVATALAFVAWFTGLRHLPAGTVGLIGLLNPLTGVLLGTVVAGEVLTGRQLLGLLLVLAGVTLGRPARAGRRGQRPEVLRRLTPRPVSGRRPATSPPPAARPCTSRPTPPGA
ncbi:putative blue pigment (indigoidine) exporter [Streptomyces sp. Ag109_O5-1]|uniref:EamA family transporter n=1 Tax=Streptomyces sp. Ag109_O5-1 TaxID=1938851 RepID=UPI000F99E467|nr:EamA family transporter [Streptomyces sp. Ag109_O5-1]RPE43618.1 putative blue pigment (indigoidine) exporter [Streptomyces sp. Ag109_O5-1]